MIKKQKTGPVMKIDREIMLRHLRKAANLKVKKICIAQTKPPSDSSEFFITMPKSPRLIMPLTREKRIRFAENGSVQDRIFIPGEALVCHPLGWSSEVWDREHSMISIVFRDRYIRTLFIHHSGQPPEPDGPDIFFHTASPLSPAGACLLHAVLSARPDSESQHLSLQALLRNVVETVECDQTLSGVRENFNWDYVQDYLETHFHLDITRESVSKKLHLHPATLSRLVRKMTGLGINEYISRLRMDQACKLLKENTLSIDEIADQCGYRYTSYFIRKFRRYYADSPFSYRMKMMERRKR